MTAIKIRLMGLSIKGELLSSGRILKTWPLWKALHWVALSLQWLFFGSEDWLFYSDLRLGILRRLISTLEEMDGKQDRSVAHWLKHPLDSRELGRHTRSPLPKGSEMGSLSESINCVTSVTVVKLT